MAVDGANAVNIAKLPELLLYLIFTGNSERGQERAAPPDGQGLVRQH
jgi:hypothetical protein